MSLAEQLTEEERTRLVTLRQLRVAALSAHGQASMRYDRALTDLAGAGDEKQLTRAAVEEIDKKIGEEVSRLATEKGIRGNIELDLNALP